MIAASLPGQEAVPVTTTDDQRHLTCQRIDLGWLPALSLVAACGLLLVAIGDLRARTDGTFAEGFFWVGLILLYVSLAARLAAPAIARPESLRIVLMLTGALYLVKLMHSPVQFTFPDEFFGIVRITCRACGRLGVRYSAHE